MDTIQKMVGRGNTLSLTSKDFSGRVPPTTHLENMRREIEYVRKGICAVYTKFHYS
jgi:hypothetical protein